MNLRKFFAEQKPRTTLTALVVVIAAAAAGLTVSRILHSQPSVEDGKQAPLAREIDSKSIAVLPFENLSGDETNAYFVSGMRDEILTKLARLRDLKVTSRTSTEKYQSHPENLRAVSRELSVATVLEGSVQKAGDDVLINLQLIDGRDDRHLWAQSYRRNIKDVFSVEGEVAQKVADALAIKLEPTQEQLLVAPATTSARAHDLFLRAHALGAHSDERSLAGKIAFLQEAVAEDPQYFHLFAPIVDH